MIRLSVIIPCYKAEKTLKRCLDSLLKQTFQGLELICVNDGSPDGCLSILKEYREKYGRRIVIINKENEGVWKARKDGIEAARGEYTGFLDPDDYADKDYARQLYYAAKKYDADIAVCGFKRVDEEGGRVYSTEMISFPYRHFDIRKEPGLLTEVNTALWNKIFKTTLIKKMGDIKCIPGVLDDMMFAQLIYINCRSIAFVPKPLVYYMVRRDSVMNTVDASLVPGVYKGMREVRSIYERSAPELLAYLDAAAFLHLCISFMYRLSEAEDFKHIFKRNGIFMDRLYPGWRKSPYISLKYSLSHKGANARILLMKVIYAFGLFPAFLTAYKFMIKYLKKDIKW